MIGDRMRRNRRLRKSLRSHRAPRGWHPPEPVVEIDEPTFKLNDLDGPTVRVTTGAGAPPTEAAPVAAAGRRHRLAVAVVVAVALVAALALYLARDRMNDTRTGQPGSAAVIGSAPAGSGGSGNPSHPLSGDPAGSGTPTALPTASPTGPAAGPTASPTVPASPTAAGPSISVGALATCGGGLPGVAVSFMFEDTSATGFHARVTVDNTGTRRIRSWRVTFDNLTGIVSGLTGGLFHLLGAVFDGNGPLDAGDRGTLEFGVRGATGQPTGCHVTVTY